MKTALLSEILLLVIIFGSTSSFSQVTSSATSTVTFAVNRSSQLLVINYGNGSEIQTSPVNTETGVFDSPTSSRPIIITASHSQTNTGNIIRYHNVQFSSTNRTEFFQRLDKNTFSIRSDSDPLSSIKHKSDGNPIIITVTN